MASVLVVDDDADGREFLIGGLAKAGFAVHAAVNGRDALQQMLARSPDVIVLDVMMPEMSGLELLQILRSYLRWTSMPVVVVTAYPSGPHISRARELRAARVFEKANYQLADLIACVRQLAEDATGQCESVG